MVDFSREQNRLVIKLVYYGPAQSGKTTNLMRLHDLLRPELKGEMLTMETKDDRTLFFDVLPLGFRTPSGLLVKFKLYTVPGQVKHDSTRKAVLSRADGVAFIADSQINQGRNNAESFENLEDNALRVGLDFDNLPLVVQFNKRDLDQIVTEEEVMQRWGEAPWPLFFSSALHGKGIAETFEGLLRSVYLKLDKELHLASEHQLDEQEFISKGSGFIPA